MWPTTIPALDRRKNGNVGFGQHGISAIHGSITDFERKRHISFRRGRKKSVTWLRRKSPVLQLDERKGVKREV